VKVNEIIVEAPTDPRTAGGVPKAIDNLKANMRSRYATKPSANSQPAANPATAADPETTNATPVTTNATPAQTNTSQEPAAVGNRGSAGSTGPGFMSGLMRGMGANQSADAIDAYNKTKGGNLGGAATTPPTTATPPAAATPAEQPAAELEPITIGKEKIKPGDPRYAALAKNLFRDPSQIPNQWEAFKATNPGNGAIMKLRPVVKNMLMRTGATRVESRQVTQRQIDEGFIDTIKKGARAARRNAISGVAAGAIASTPASAMSTATPTAPPTRSAVATQPAAVQKAPVAPTATQPTQTATATNIFANPAQLEQDWEAYLDAGGRYTPAIRKALKDIWMNMGGIKVESTGGVPWKVKV
jgi:hypothetical protein